MASDSADTIASQVAALHNGRSDDNVWAIEQTALSRDPVTPALPLGADFPDSELLSPTGEATTLAATLGGSRRSSLLSWRLVPVLQHHSGDVPNPASQPLAQRGIILVALNPRSRTVR